MEHIELNKGIKEALRVYSVPEEVINMIEEENNVKVQTVADFYEKQILDIENKQKKVKKELSSTEFMETLKKHRIIDK